MARNGLHAPIFASTVTPRVHTRSGPAVSVAHPRPSDRRALVSPCVPCRADRREDETIDELLTTEEAAAELRVSQKTVLRLIRSGDLRAQKVGRSWRIRRHDLPCVAGETDAGSDAIYLDDNASNPLHPAVLRLMSELWAGPIGNASSTHEIGARSRAIIEDAREGVAGLLQARSNEVVFTSGATEANNLVLRGFRFAGKRLLVSAGDHASVRHVAQAMSGDVPHSVVPLNREGVVDLDTLASMLAAKDVALVSIVAANSETGVLNPIPDVAELVHAAGAVLHCDATQWIGRLAFSMEELGADAVSLSGHKMSGPQGVGALVARRSILRALAPQAVGGGHEDGIRSGSYNVVGIAALGAAAALAADPLVADQTCRVRDRLIDGLSKAGGTAVNGIGADRLPNTANVRFAGAPGDAVLARCRGVAASLGSACHAGTIEPSPTLLAMGLSRDEAEESIRFSVTRFTTLRDVDVAAARIARAVAAIRALEEVA